MAKIIGISGPQGGGKTTLLNGLAEKGLIVDDFKVSREVQSRLGWSSLDRVMEDVDTMIEFQTAVAEVKYGRDRANQASDESIILVERTFADIACYTQHWAYNHVAMGNWALHNAINFLSGFVDNCEDLQAIYDSVIYLPAMPNVKFEADSHRAAESGIESFTEDLENFFRLKQQKTVPVFQVTKQTVEDRVNQCYEWIQTR